MPIIFEHQVHQTIIYTSNRRYSIHTNKNSRIGLKNFLQSGVAKIEEVPHAQQTSDICERHHVGYDAYRLVSLCYVNQGGVSYNRNLTG